MCLPGLGRTLYFMSFSLKPHYQCAIAGCLLLVGAATAEAGPKGDSEMENAQAEMARAYGRYYDGVKSGAVDSTSRSSFGSEVMGSAQSKLARLVSSREERSDRILFGKVYSSDGRISNIPPGGYVEPPSQGSAESERSSASGASGEGSESVTPSGSTSGNGVGTGASFRNGRKRMEYTLDGKNVPRELDFTGGGKAGKPTQK